MSDPTAVIGALRSSHDRFAALVEGLTTDQLRAQSYDPDWSIADVASHLGSQAEIFELMLQAGLAGAPAPGGESFPPIWDRWNALSPDEQVRNSVSANEAFVTRLQQLPTDQATSFALSTFGMDFDLAGLAQMRLGEHALHTWDIAVALDRNAVVAQDAVDELIDTLDRLAGRSGKPVENAEPVSIRTTGPARRFDLQLQPTVELIASDSSDEAAVVLPAEALVRLVYGRLDAEHTPTGISGADLLDLLRAAFPGF